MNDLDRALTQLEVQSYQLDDALNDLRDRIEDAYGELQIQIGELIRCCQAKGVGNVNPNQFISSSISPDNSNQETLKRIIAVTAVVTDALKRIQNMGNTEDIKKYINQVKLEAENCCNSNNSPSTAAESKESSSTSRSIHADTEDKSSQIFRNTVDIAQQQEQRASEGQSFVDLDSGRHEQEQRTGNNNVQQLVEQFEQFNNKSKNPSNNKKRKVALETQSKQQDVAAAASAAETPNRFDTKQQGVAETPNRFDTEQQGVAEQLKQQQQQEFENKIFNLFLQIIDANADSNEKRKTKIDFAQFFTDEYIKQPSKQGTFPSYTVLANYIINNYSLVAGKYKRKITYSNNLIKKLKKLISTTNHTGGRMANYKRFKKTRKIKKQHIYKQKHDIRGKRHISRTSKNGKNKSWRTKHRRTRLSHSKTRRN